MLPSLALAAALVAGFASTGGRSAASLARADAEGPPRHIRIFLPEDPSRGIRLLWRSGRPAAPVAEITDGDGAVRKVAAEVLALSGGGVACEARVDGLLPGRRYRFRVGSQDGSLSAPGEFDTAPEDAAPFRFTAFGDQGTGPAARRATEAAIALSPAFHLLLGDASYADGDPVVWDAWLDLIEPLSRRIPVMLTPGNHEMESRDGGPRSLDGLRGRFVLPGGGGLYAFRYGDVAFISFDTNRRLDRRVFQWLHYECLEARRDPRVRWLIVFQHAPLHGSVRNRGPDRTLIEEEEPILDRHSVDLVLAGHDHVYERTLPLRERRVASTERAEVVRGTGTVHVTAGIGGRELYTFESGDPPASTAYREAAHGVVVVDVDPAGALRVEARRLDGSVMDRFVIREPGWRDRR